MVEESEEFTLVACGKRHKDRAREGREGRIPD